MVPLPIRPVHPRPCGYTNLLVALSPGANENEVLPLACRVCPTILAGEVEEGMEIYFVRPVGHVGAAVIEGEADVVMCVPRQVRLLPETRRRGPCDVRSS
ncbi:hypothetical protein PILCRDRAFT_266349 [Piloderma croceum F 1598]|uniref:Uncharacterized protein n=1 Tax=Piloderma croceum (strain F 1598) TaxID=765440 RepID=A0A0C3CDX6_PILCF|nr:hypothetical protein PILCRDRAFT_266349 [Piloderma croceum F 1598]